MPKLRKVYYYTRSDERKINAYNICLTKKDIETAGFDDNAMFKVTAEKGKIYIEQEKNKGSEINV